MRVLYNQAELVVKTDDDQFADLHGVRFLENSIFIDFIFTSIVICLHQTIYWNPRLPIRQISALSSDEELTDTEN